MLSSLSQALRDLGKSPRRLVSASALSFLYWILVGLTAWLVALAVEVQISPIVATLVILGSIFFATSVPGAPSAIGTFEFAVVTVLGLLGEDNKGAAFGFAVITHAVFFLPSTIIAAVFLPREGLGSIRTVRQTLFKGARAGCGCRSSWMTKASSTRVGTDRGAWTSPPATATASGCSIWV